MISGITEEQLEEILLTELKSLGWNYAFGPDMAPGESNAERSNYEEVLIIGRLADSIKRINPDLTSDEVNTAVKQIQRVESQAVQAENWRSYQLLKDGVVVEYKTASGEFKDKRVKVIDWDNPEKNEFLAVNQFTVVGSHERRPDVVLFINGIPVSIFELKRPGSENASLRSAFNQIQTYVSQIPQLFRWNQMVIISDGVQARASTFESEWEHFAPWKTINGKDLAPSGVSELEVLTNGMFNKSIFLDLIQNFIVYSGDGLKLKKKLAKYHQFWAVNKALHSTIEAMHGDGRAGVVWHTQGSGKSLEMEWYTAKVLRHPKTENPTVVVVTDRNDLDDQLYVETFCASKIGAPLPEVPVQANSRAELRELLNNRMSGGIVFTTIQKFGQSQEEKQKGSSFPELSKRKNIVVMVDEAHRSNYDFIDGFARNVRDALPNATYIGFTGTPIETKDKSTVNVFGNYIDVYDLNQAVLDGATVKVYYEPRLAKVELPKDVLDKLDESFTAATSGTEEEAVERLKSRWGQIEAVVGSEKRIAELATDLIEHWEARRGVLSGKAIVVTMSRRIAVQLYEQIASLRPSWVSSDDATGKVKVVITGSASDPSEMQPHIRNKESLRALKARAKNPNDELEIVIVRDMWLTGFDSPSMHTMYVDKPMRGANLMQAIARVNRTFKDKPSGLVVDYLGIAEDLTEALADYTQRDQESQCLGEDLEREAIPGLLAKHDVCSSILFDFKWREKLAGDDQKAFLNTLTATVEYLLSQHNSTSEIVCTKLTPCRKCRFQSQVRDLVKLFVICVPAPQALALKNDIAFFEAVRGQISKIEGGDREGSNSSALLETAIKQIVSESMTSAGVIDIYAEAGIEKPDLSLINEEFIAKFKTSKNPNLQIELIRRLINNEITSVRKRNLISGKKFSELLETSILKYQNRALDAAEIIAELVALAKSLQAESRRGQEIGLDESELAFYDAISVNESAVLELGDDTLKKIAHELVEIIRRDAKTDWNVKEQVRAKLRATIKRLLLKYGYPPDASVLAVETVIEQAESLTELWIQDKLNGQN